MDQDNDSIIQVEKKTENVRKTKNETRRHTCRLSISVPFRTAHRHATATLRIAPAVRPALQTQLGRIMSRTTDSTKPLKLFEQTENEIWLDQITEARFQRNPILL